MLLWLILALMTAVALGAVLWPLLRHRGTSRSGSDVAVYRDQLEGIGRDQTLGLIPASEAEAARVEISRRLLAAADRAKQSAAASSASRMRGHGLAALAILLLLPLGAGGLYLWLGSPDIAAAPIAGRQKAVAEQRAVEDMVTQVETYLQRNPNDGRGWEVLAPVYMRLGRYDESATAWRNAIQYLGETAERQANLGESLTASTNGLITTEAKTAFDRAVELDPTLVSARYYQGLAAEQDGRRDEAAKIWRELMAAAPAGAHWVDSVREALARVEGKPGAAPPTVAQGPAPAAPSAAKSAEAQGGGDHQISGMVERLAERLKKDGSDPDGWVMLVRSYKVTGQIENMQGAIADARRALAGDADKLQQFETGLKDVESGAPAAAAAAPGAPPSSAANPEANPSATPGTGADGRRGPSTSEAAGQAPASAASGAGGASKSAEAQGGDQIRGMVERLAERLKKDGSDPDGWVMLVRSYKVVGQTESMQGAIADARRALADDADKLQRFEAGLKDVESGAPAAAAPTAGSPPSAAANPEATPSATPGTSADPGRGPSASEAAGQAPASAAPGAGGASKSAEAQGSDPSIGGMVARLAERLKKDGSDPDRWVMLVRSYKVLGQTEQMQSAVADARRALAGDPDKLRHFEAGLKDVESSAPPAAVPAPGSPPSSAASPEATPGASPGASPGAGRGPSASDMAAAEAMTPEQRDARIRGMVGALAERLKNDGSDLDGWMRLVRSYVVLGESDKARAAVADARRALGADAQKLRQLDDFVKGLGIEG